jgi:hypothetical protein
MVGSRSSPDRPTLDVFQCLNCDTQIRIDSSRDSDSDSDDRGHD